MKYNLVHVSGAVLGTVSWKGSPGSQQGRWILDMQGEGPLFDDCFAAVANALAEDELGNCSKAHFLEVMTSLFEEVLGKAGPQVPVRVYPVEEY